MTLQKILRIITFSSYDSTSLTLFTKFGISNKNDLLTGSFSFCSNNNTLPPYSKDFCTLNSKMHNYYTRSSRNLHKTFNRTNYSIYSTCNKMIDIWNSILDSIEHSNSVLFLTKRWKSFYYPSEISFLYHKVYYTFILQCAIIIYLLLLTCMIIILSDTHYI